MPSSTGSKAGAEMGIEQISPTLVIGAGLVGASIGCALTEAGVVVHLKDRERSHTIVAAGRGAGRLEEPDRADVKLVIVATPPAVIAEVITASLEQYPNAAITDVGSVKARIADDLAARRINFARYVGGHPMAGSHQSGPLTAAPELFVDRTWVITPRPENPEWVVERVRTLATTCGARIRELDAAEHDRAVAEVSHFPQLVSSLTAARLAQVPQDDLRLAGQGLRDVTRIAASDVKMWRQIVAANTPLIREQLVAMRADLDRLISSLDDPRTVVDLLRRGNDGVRALPSKRGKLRNENVSVVVEIPDAPGALAQLFASMTDNGVNIEDLSIEHDPERSAGYLSIDVAPERADALRQLIRDHGWGLRS
ncbi:prephenate dehydrogenase [Propionimicrobium sp. PCR01-08-3]|uniref:prephenate dehydrogenase n=1 Tax=Propionimicrobium sp. PCR01-08-3 TaxID=3052086 RepID=UPI00255CC9D0|nr:prephenate dehydrogenase [Propionimicrobium sp. PCR01-08-3]WIY83923.1 prephenate dehydrogenase [Propionimicrobium sp. PCR01-08-3]